MPWLATEGSSLNCVVFATAFVWLSVALGRRILILLGAQGSVSPSERGVIAAGLGAGVLQFVPFALGALGIMTTTSMRLAIGVLVLAAAVDLRAVGASVIAVVRRRTRVDNWTVCWLLALSPALLMASLVALTPALDPDGLAYHLTVPKRWMETGRLDYLPTYPYSNAPMGAEMLFGLGMAFSGDAAAKCIHYVLGVAAAAAIYLAGTRLSNRAVGAVLATLFLVGPAGVATLLGFAYVEGAVSLATAGSVLSWLVWYQTGNRGYLRSAALLAGVAVSFKISAALFPMALLAVTAVAIAARAREGQTSTGLVNSAFLGSTSAAALIPLVAIPILPWLMRAFLVTGNPLFPLFANVIPSRDYSAELATQVDRYNRYMTWGHSIGRGWTLEQRAWILLGVAVLLALLGGLAFLKLRGRTTRGVVVVVTITSIVQLTAVGLYIRYWIPIAAPLTLPIAAALAPIISRRNVMVAWLGVTLAGSLVQARASYVDVGSNLTGLLRTVVGRDERLDFLRDRLPLYPLYEYVNRNLPPEAGIVLSAYCGGFYIDRRTFCAEFVQNSLRFTTWDEFTADLRRLRITHVIAPRGLATGDLTPDLGGSSAAAITRAGQYRMVGQLLASHARILFAASDQGLYEITPALLAAPSATHSGTAVPVQHIKSSASVSATGHAGGGEFPAHELRRDF